MEGWGRQSIANLRYSIDSKRKISFDRFIYSLGIRHIGLENAKLIARNLKTPKNFFLLSNKDKLNELSIIDGIGETQINSIRSFFSNKTNLRVLKELEKILSIDSSIESKKGGPLQNKSFLITGKLIGMSRAEAKSLIEQNSGRIVSNVSSKLDYLIVGEKPTKRKIETAQQLNIKVLDQISLTKLLKN